MNKNSIAVIVFDRISPFHLSVPCIMFGEDRSGKCPVKFDLKVCSLEQGSISTSAGFNMEARYGLKDISRASIVIVPTWRDTNEIPPKPLLDALRRAHKRGALIVACVLVPMCWLRRGCWMAGGHHPLELGSRSGGTISAGQGKSGGALCGSGQHNHFRRHGLGDRLLSAYYPPRIRGEPGQLHGATHVVSPHRQGGQAQFIQQPVRDISTVDHFSEVLEWSRRNLDKPHSLDLLAGRALMTRRTFTRRFKQVMA